MILVKAKLTGAPRKLLIMVMNIIRIFIRRWISYVKYMGRHRFVLLVLILLVLWPALWWIIGTSSLVFLQPRPEQSLQYKTNRSLHHYLKGIQTLIEPAYPTCGRLHEVPMIIMVTTTSANIDQRKAVRATWGIYQPTYFVMGLSGDKNTQLKINYLEAEEFQDMIVFDFHDHDQNQTLKTALLMQWTLDFCPHIRFLFKTQDDVLVNPWKLNKVLLNNINAQLVGYIFRDAHLLRNECRKGYNPRVLREGGVARYLSGTGYLVSGDHIKMILNKACQVPVLNLEDVYYTYLIADKELGLTLSHDRRLSPYKPWLSTGCLFWDLASIHGLSPIEMFEAWALLENLVISYQTIADVCKGFNICFYFFKDFMLY